MNEHSRRRFLQYVAISGSALTLPGRLVAQVSIPDTINPGIGPYPDSWLPEGVRSRFVESVNGLRMHVLEAGFEAGLRTGTGRRWSCSTDSRNLLTVGAM